jgi:hypothetical protein
MDSWKVDLRLTHFGRQGSVSPIDVALPELSAERVVYHHAGLTEWYLNSAQGVEQGFEIPKPPPPRGTNHLVVLQMTMGTELKSKLSDSRTLSLRTDLDQEAVRYSGLQVSDATGTHLEASLTLAGDSLSIRFDDGDAVYPIKIDPLLTTPSWSTSGTGQNFNLGYSVASAGDINHDSYADILVGVPYFDSGLAAEGRVFVYLGTNIGPVQTDWNYQVGQGGALFGLSVASAGDVNGDTYADVIIGAPYEDHSETDEGRVYVFLGSSTGLSSTPTIILEKDQSFAAFGSSVASLGDINGDGKSDFIVGAPFFHSGESDEGGVWVYKGGTIPLSSSPHWHAESNLVNARFGWSVSSAGDINGDGFSDVLVGAPHYSSGESNEGWAFLWKSKGTQGMGNTNGKPSNATWSAQSNSANAQFGVSVASAGNVNGDTNPSTSKPLDDIIIGAERYTNGQLEEGGAFVWYGTTSGLSGLGNAASTANWRAESNQAAPVVGAGPYFGHAVSSAGDVNNDGFGDILIGAHYFKINASAPGSVFLWQGSATGLGPNGTPSNMTQRLDGNESGGQFGFSVAGAGDVDKDNFDDVLVGAPLQTATFTGAGKAYYYRGQADGCQVLCQVTWCKFQDFLCTADCVGSCCDYSNCVTQACTAEACPPNACSCN